MKLISKLFSKNKSISCKFEDIFYKIGILINNKLNEQLLYIKVFEDKQEKELFELKMEIQKLKDDMLDMKCDCDNTIVESFIDGLDKG